MLKINNINNKYMYIYKEHQHNKIATMLVLSLTVSKKTIYTLHHKQHSAQN